MLRRIWQTCMIGLGRNTAMQRIAQRWSASSRLARRYVAGPTASDAVRCADELIRDGIRASMFHLGEYVTTIDLVRENVANKISVAGALGQAKLDVHISVDPTQIGMLIDRDLARENAFDIAAKIQAAASSRPGVHCLMLDMEDESVVDWTLRLHDSLQDAGFPVAITVQAYLRRTEGDLFNLIDRGATVRLVRGAFAAKRGTAHTTSADIKSNYMRLARLMLSVRARATGFYPVFGTPLRAFRGKLVALRATTHR
jgi:proline dehydrogenase